MGKKFDQIIQDALDIIDTFPKSRNGHHFLTLKNGKKLFFSVFMKKYGLTGIKNKYNEQDVIRRIRLIEFFDYFVKDYDIQPGRESKMIIESKFHRMVIIKVGRPGRERLELLSFYPYK